MTIARALRVGVAATQMVWMTAASVHPQSGSEIPHLKKQGSATQLIVHGKPFLMLAGELGNSSASDTKTMAQVWPRLNAMRVNTILMPVYWELVEPREGQFEFALVDDLIASARKHDLKIVVLWFGSWKNSMSCYAPAWVKTDQRRFPRARTSDGRPLEILTPFSEENRKADVKAFTRVMEHLRAVDGRHHTVVMVQVENEIGMIPQARDHGPEADEAFGREVPADLLEYLRANTGSLTEEMRQSWGSTGNRRTGSWEQVFGTGPGTEEFFMAWHFARYTNAVAEAGKAVYPLPMYVNAALIRPKYTPGQYPSGGPLPHLADVWRAGAPAIDFLAPDIYFRNYAEWLGKYDRAGNAVFVPEVDRHQSITNAFYAFARHNAMGYSPFSIESAEHAEERQITRGYDVLHQLTPLILEHQGTGRLAGFLLDSAAQTAEIKLGNYAFTVKHEYTWPYAARAEGATPRVGGMIIMVSPEEFFVAGSGVVVTFAPAADAQAVAGILSIDEGSFVKRKWTAGRRMNGDEDHQGRHLHLPAGTFGIQKVRLYTYR